MSTWFSEYRVKTLADHIAPRLLPKIEAIMLEAATQAIRPMLSSMLMDAFKDIAPELTPKNSLSMRRERDQLIRARYNGRNAVELAHQFGISARQIHNIAGPARKSSP